MREGFYVNLGLYPAVPVKNTGVRITISRHNTFEEMEARVKPMAYHLPKALEETHGSLNQVRIAFRMDAGQDNYVVPQKQQLKVRKPVLLRNLGEKSGMLFLEKRDVLIGMV